MYNLSILESVGLSQEEIAVYKTLLESEEHASIRSIAAACGINRGLVYEALKSLNSKGMVSYHFIGKRKQYFAESPKKFLDIITEKKHELELIETKTKLMLPKLLEVSRHHVGEPLVRYYQDDEGIVSILRDILSTTSKLPVKEYYTYSSRSIRPYIYRNFPNYNRRRQALGVFVKVIKIGEGEGEKVMDECRWLKEPRSDQSASYGVIYGNKVALISVASDGTPYGVVIEDPGVAATHRLIFEKLWTSL